MTIGIDGRCLAGRPTGVGRYVSNLLRELAARSDPDGFRPEYRVFLPAGSRVPGLESARVRTRALRLPALDNAFVWTHVRLPVHLARRGVDLLHAPFYTLPAVCPCPAVVTIHDVTFELHPEWYTPRARIAFRGFGRWSARRARHVLTVSERSRQDIVQRYGIAPSRVTSVPLAPDPRFRPVRDPETIRRVRSRHSLEGDYLLHVGSITPRRNVGRLLDAFVCLRRRAPGLRLALAGSSEPPAPPVEAEIRRRGLGDAVRVLGYVPEEDLPALYSAATAAVYPSLYEGFGLPVLEAMACGTPVLASLGSCFPEVAGDAALLVDPTSTEAIADGLWRVVADEGLRADLAARGPRRAAAFSWRETARRTLEVYRAALGLAASGGAPGPEGAGGGVA